MYIISKSFQFSASHLLMELPQEHPCSMLHGHNYTVIIELRSTVLDEQGFVLDYRSLDPIKKWINNTMDHRHLNDVVTFNPTAENLAKYIFDKATEIIHLHHPDIHISAVTVKETDKTSARYEPDPD